MNFYSEYESKINQLVQQIESLTAELKSNVNNAINEVANENKRPKISSHIFTVKLSELSNKPWSPSFHDWEASAEILINKLKDMPANKVVPFLKSLYEKRNKNNVCTFNGKTYTKGNVFVFSQNVTYTINSDVIEKILIKLGVL